MNRTISKTRTDLSGSLDSNNDLSLNMYDCGFYWLHGFVK